MLPSNTGQSSFVSMELTDVDLAVRLVSVITNIRTEKLVTGALSPEQTQQVLDAIERLSHSRLHIVFGSGYASADVRAYAPAERRPQYSPWPFDAFMSEVEPFLKDSIAGRLPA